jgi:DhnA family fructose-bisphosphate aldolase class Ia
MDTALRQICTGEPNALLGFAGQFERYYEIVQEYSWIINLTASTSLSQHTNKQLVMNLRGALEAGCDAVAVHVNVTSAYEPQMIRSLGSVIADSRAFGVPVLAIMYPRGETPDGTDDNYTGLRTAMPNHYTRLIAHAVRIAADLGASIVKTHYTGSADSFSQVIDAAGTVPVLISGGPLTEPGLPLQIAAEAISAGGAGVSYGRNVFSRDEPWRMVRALRDVVIGGMSPTDALDRHKPK